MKNVRIGKYPPATVKIMASMSATVDAIRNRHKPVKPA